MSSVYQSVSAWRHALESILLIGGQLPDPAWASPTECPRWTVKDVYAHLIGGERWMADGQPAPAEGIDAWADGPVRARRDVAPGKLLTELREVYELRRMQLERGTDPHQPSHFPTGGPADLGQVLRLRVLDVWAHEQDIRRAVGRPGNLASPGAAIAGEVFVSALPRIVAKTAAAPPGSMFRLTTRGEVGMDVAVAVDQEGRGAVVAPGRSATAHALLSWEAYTRLSCGRGARADYEIRVTGDRSLAERVLTNLAVTP